MKTNMSDKNLKIEKDLYDILYGKILVENKEDDNLNSDINLFTGSFQEDIEIKRRFFNTSTERYLYEDDILIEQFQDFRKVASLKIQDLQNNCINKNLNAFYFDQMPGWLYKCNATKVFYFRYLNSQPYDCIILDWIPFKKFLQNLIVQQQRGPKEHRELSLVSSFLTTGAINLKIKIKDIPLIYRSWMSYSDKWERKIK